MAIEHTTMSDRENQFDPLKKKSLKPFTTIEVYDFTNPAQNSTTNQWKISTFSEDLHVE